MKIFIRLILFLFWSFVGLMGAGFLLFGLLYYMHLHPFDHGTFDRDLWIAEGKKGGNAERCWMSGTVMDEIVIAGMPRKTVEEKIGTGNKTDHYQPADGTSVYDYYLGWCSPMAWDPYSMMIHYDANDNVIATYGHQH